MEKELTLPERFDDLYSNISEMIISAKAKAFKKLNNEQLLLNWSIGKRLKTEILNNAKAEYGKLVVVTMSKMLTQEYGRGYSKSELFRMIKFFDTFGEKEKVATLSQQLTWSHFKDLITIDEPLKREFYATICMKEKWGVRTLRERKSSMLFERTAISKKPEETIANELKELQDVHRFILS